MGEGRRGEGGKGGGGVSRVERGHMKLNNGKINSVTYPEFFIIYLYM